MFIKRRVEALQEREVFLENRISELMREKNKLLDTVDALKVENKRLKVKREMDEELIAHKLQMREEEREIEYLKDETKLREECAEAIREVKYTYQEKVEQHLEKRNSELRDMYSEILERLPEINVGLKGNV